jgi:hypothetical protein
MTKCLNGWLLGTNLGLASAAGLRSYNSWLEPRLTPHRTGRTCKATHPTRSTSSCGDPCLSNCPQIPRVDRCSASLLCCIAVHIPCTLTTHQMLMARLCVSRVPVESIKIAFSGQCPSQELPPGYTNSWLRLPRTNPLSAVTLTMFTSWDPPASLVAIGDAMPVAYASVGLMVTMRKNCLHYPLDVGDAFDNLPNGQIMRGVHVSTEGTKILGGPMGTSDFDRDVFETALRKYEAYGERLRGPSAHWHSHTAHRIHRHCNRRL